MTITEDPFPTTPPRETSVARRRCAVDTRPHSVVEEWIVLDNCAHAEWPGVAFAQIDQAGDLTVGPLKGSPYTAFCIPAAVVRKLMTRHRQVKTGKISGRVHALGA